MRGAVVDPGGDLHLIDKAITENGVTIEKVILTHGHLDHAGAAAELSETLGVPIEGPHPDDQYWIRRHGRTGPGVRRRRRAGVLPPIAGWPAAIR